MVHLQVVEHGDDDDGGGEVLRPEEEDRVAPADGRTPQQEGQCPDAASSATSCFHPLKVAAHVFLVLLLVAFALGYLVRGEYHSHLRAIDHSYALERYERRKQTRKAALKRG
jgi:hypothetical protein